MTDAQRAKKWRDSHREQHRAACKAWRQLHGKAWRDSHREQRNTESKVYADSHRDQCRAAVKKWRESRPEHCKKYGARFRAECRDGYVAARLGLGVLRVPRPLLEAKRAQLTLTRSLRRMSS